MHVTYNDINNRMYTMKSTPHSGNHIKPRLYTESGQFCKENAVHAIMNWEDLAETVDEAFNIALDIFGELCLNANASTIRQSASHLIEGVNKVRDATQLQNSIKYKTSRIKTKLTTNINNKIDDANDAVNNATSDITSKINAIAAATGSSTGSSSANLSSEETPESDEVAEEAFNALLSAATKAKECDRIVSNYDKTSKRFNLDRLITEAVYPDDMYQAMWDVARCMDTYNTSFKKKYMCALENARYVLDKHYIKYDSEQIIEGVTDYFIFTSGLTESDLNDIASVKNTCSIINESAFDRLNYLYEDDSGTLDAGLSGGNNGEDSGTMDAGSSDSEDTAVEEADSGTMDAGGSSSSSDSSNDASADVEDLEYNGDDQMPIFSSSGAETSADALEQESYNIYKIFDEEDSGTMDAGESSSDYDSTNDEPSSETDNFEYNGDDQMPIFSSSGAETSADAAQQESYGLYETFDEEDSGTLDASSGGSLGTDSGTMDAGADTSVSNDSGTMQAGSVDEEDSGTKDAGSSGSDDTTSSGDDVDTNDNNGIDAYDTTVTEALLKDSKDIYYNKDKFDSGETNLCFITGLSGSGKTTMAGNMKDKSNVESIELDDVLYKVIKCKDIEETKQYGNTIYSFFKGPGKKYFNILKEKKDDCYKELINAFVNYTIQVAHSHKNNKYIVNGYELYAFIDPNKIKDYAVYIKGTSAVKSSYRGAKRDFKDQSGVSQKVGTAKLAATRVGYAIARDQRGLNKYAKFFSNLIKESACGYIVEDDSGTMNAGDNMPNSEDSGTKDAGSTEDIAPYDDSEDYAQNVEEEDTGSLDAGKTDTSKYDRIGKEYQDAYNGLNMEGSVDDIVMNIGAALKYRQTINEGLAKNVKIAGKDLIKDAKKGNPNEKTDEEASKMIDDFRKSCAKDPDNKNNMSRLKALVIKLFARTPNQIVNNLPSIFSIVRAGFVISATSIAAPLGIVSLVADQIIKIKMDRKNTEKAIKQYNKEIEKVKKKIDKYKDNSTKEKYKKYLKALESDLSKIEDYRDSIHTEKENEEREEEEERKAEEKAEKEAKKNSKSNDEDDDDFDWDDDDWDDDDWDDDDDDFDEAANIIVVSELVSSINECLVDDKDLDGVIFGNVFRLSDDTIDDLTDFAVTVPVILEKEKLCDALKEHRAELRKNPTIKDYIRIDTLNDNIYKLEHSAPVYYDTHDMLATKSYLYCLNELAKLNKYETYQIEAMSFKNTIKLAIDRMKKAVTKLSDKEKQISQSIDASASQVSKSLEKASLNNNREAIIKGSMIPSASKCIKTALGLGVAWAINPALAVIGALGKFACSKKRKKKERQIVLDEIEVELKMVERYLRKAEDENDLEKVRYYEMTQRTLQRQHQRIKYSMHVYHDKVLDPRSPGDNE